MPPSSFGASPIRGADGSAPIRDYAVIGDGRTAALVARDGSIDWLCLPDVDSPSIFARLLDAEKGGCFAVAPVEPFECEQRYLDDSNVLTTTFRTASGAVRMTDAMTLAEDRSLSPLREVVRKVESIAGSVDLEWRFEPRFGYGSAKTTLARRDGGIVATSGRDAVALSAFDAAEGRIADGAATGRFSVADGGSALLSLCAAHREPLVVAGRDDAERRLESTARFWRSWAGRLEYRGPWRDAVMRSALALKLLVFAPSGAIVAAPTMSLPEWIGGGRNWDYRYAWVRDAAFTLVALMRLGYEEEARAFFWWLAHATALTHPELKVLYRVSGRLKTREREVGSLSGYRGSRPVRVGNGAEAQTQLDVYGYMFHAVCFYAERAGELPGAHGRAIAKIADWVADNWHRADSGIWEVRSRPRHFIQSKAMCWVALDRACRLAARGFIPDRRERWRAEADAIRRFVDEHGWDDAAMAYRRAPDVHEADGSHLTLALLGYDDAAGPRAAGTIDAVRRELGTGPLVDRYRGEDGVRGRQGIFLTCSFWLAAALAKAGRHAEAAALMEELLALANHVGLYAEEIEPDGTFLGNFPQALVHLALIDAAVAVADVEHRK